MNISSSRENHRLVILGGALIVVIAALSYLTLANKLGFNYDDWYLLYAGQTEGFDKFFDVFAIDRPFRAYFVGGVFELFGLAPLPYHVLSYALRVAGALGMFWLLRLLWPERPCLGLALAVLFAIYPGWNDQPAPFDYQSHLLSFALYVFSLALTVSAMLSRAAWKKWTAIGLAVIFQVIALLLMEYYIGLEGLRFAFIAWLVSDRDLRGLFRRGWPVRMGRIVLTGLPYLLGAAGFMIWRMFFFENTRSATDISGMFSALAGSPVMRGLWMLVFLLQDFFNVSLFAWFVPVYHNTVGLRLRDSLIMIGVGLLAAGLLAAALWMLRRWAPETGPEKNPRGCDPCARDMLWLGTLGVLFSLIPIALGDRHVVFPTFSRFTLTGSIGAVLLLGGVLSYLRSESARNLALVVLVGLSVMGHYGNATRHAEYWSDMQNFWWQMSWRAPQIAPETVLLVEYPSGGISEDYFAWGPANLIYYPEKNIVDGAARTPISSVALSEENVHAARMGIALNERERRGVVSGQDLGNALVLSMPYNGSCVHVIDGRAPELAERDNYRAHLVAQSSNIHRVLSDSESHTPPAALFGSEPPHTWCYYYQKASLARQKGDWQEVARLGDEAMQNNQRPLEWVEWMPFVQAYAYVGRYDRVNELSAIVRTSRYLHRQACEQIKGDAYGYAGQYPEGHNYLIEQFCQQ